MKKQKNKQAKKASKLAKAENLKKKPAQFITVKNAEGDPDTTAEILIQNQIDYTPKVSVIIPVYNVEQYLRECLDSVVNQTLKEIEIICVDDGSTDSSLEILKEYAAKDKRMTVIRQQNLHAGVA
ncbi:glycosyltransferase family 2 protein, partial [bacterium]|nr:glycosyltransferase family 2 protein [bacterium]